MMPTPRSSSAALAANAAMSARVSGVSGMFGGGAHQLASCGEAGSKKLRWVSKKPTERKNGCGRPSRSSSATAGATSSAWCSVSTVRSRSKPTSDGRAAMCCSPTRTV